MINIKQRILDIVKEQLSLENMWRDDIELEVIDNSKDGSIGVVFGKYVEGENHISDSERKRYDYCLLDNKEKIVAKIRFSTSASCYSDTPMPNFILDDVSSALCEVMHEYYDESYPDEPSTVIEV